MKLRKKKSVLIATNSIDDCNACFLSERIWFEQFFKSTNQYPTIQNLTDLIDITFV